MAPEGFCRFRPWIRRRIEDTPLVLEGRRSVLVRLQLYGRDVMIICLAGNLSVARRPGLRAAGKFGPVYIWRGLRFGGGPDGCLMSAIWRARHISYTSAVQGGHLLPLSQNAESSAQCLRINDIAQSGENTRRFSTPPS